MSARTRRGFATVSTIFLSSLTWVALAAFGPPAQAHHGTAIGKSGGQVTAPAPAPSRSSSTPVPSSSSGGTISGTLDVGASGDQVRMVEQKLDSLKYFVGSVDGTYDDDTYQAVMAFQKANGQSRTGKVDQSTWTAMQSATDPSALVPGGPAHRVEVDLNKQILTLWNDGKVSKIIAIASGTSETPTPTGDFAIYSKSTGWETSRLGRLYNSQYFVGGYAIHGSLSVPSQPASHGCVRIPMTAADWFPGQVKIGTPVFVR